HRACTRPAVIRRRLQPTAETVSRYRTLRSPPPRLPKSRKKAELFLPCKRGSSEVKSSTRAYTTEKQNCSVSYGKDSRIIKNKPDRSEVLVGRTPLGKCRSRGFAQGVRPTIQLTARILSRPGRDRSPPAERTAGLRIRRTIRRRGPCGTRW